MKEAATPSTAPEKSDEVELDLPALDGEDDGADAVLGFDSLDVVEDEGDPFDDATGESAPVEELAVEGAEGGWLVDTDTAHTLDLGTIDVVIRPEDDDRVKLLDDEDSTGLAAGDDLVADDETPVVDAGEEGPLDDDEELREEDLPALDADDDGDVPDDDLYDRALLIADDDELRWDDRAWGRVTEVETPQADATDDSGVLAVPGEDPTHATRDATWKRMEETSRLMAAAFLPGGSVIVALGSADRARALVVRIQPDGEARIIAEVDPRAVKAPMASASGAEDDDGEACVVTFVRWDAARGCLFVGGNFGVEAYRPSA
jgi:hypothetical protein